MAAVLFIVYLPNEDDLESSIGDEDGCDVEGVPKVEGLSCSDDKEVPSEHLNSSDQEDAEDSSKTRDAKDQHAQSEDGASPSDQLKTNGAANTQAKKPVTRDDDHEPKKETANNTAKCTDTKTLETKSAKEDVSGEQGDESEVEIVQPKQSVRFTVEKVDEPETKTSPSLHELTSLEKERSLNTQMSKDSYFDMTLKEAFQQLIEDLNIEKQVWLLTEEKDHWMVKFVLQSSKRCDEVVKVLTSFGIGRIPETSLSLYHADVFMSGRDLECVKEDSKEETSVEATPNKETKGKSDRSEFVKSIKSRLIVAEVVESVKESAKITFDYMLLLIIASTIAGIGLAENSSVILVASMLVSPLMGPIMGGTFGITIGNAPLWKLSFRNESISLLICILCGFILGHFLAGLRHLGAVSEAAWPTFEMQNRGVLRGLAVGILIAVPSGAGVALSIVGGNAGPLVGVAISASLLPPAVNAGMLWAFSILAATAYANDYALPSSGTIADPSIAQANMTLNSTTTEPVLLYPPNCTQGPGGYQFQYSCNMSVESFLLGLVSFTLTLVNIVCIFIMGIIILKVKEVAPHTAASDASNAFWKRDVKMARETYRTLKGPESHNLAEMAKQLAENIVTQQKSREDELTAEETERVDRLTQSLDNIIANVEDDNTFQNIVNSRGRRKPLNRFSGYFGSQSSSSTYHGRPLSWVGVSRRHLLSINTNNSEDTDEFATPPISPTYLTAHDDPFDNYNTTRFVKYRRRLRTLSGGQREQTMGRFKVQRIKEEKEEEGKKDEVTTPIADVDTNSDVTPLLGDVVIDVEQGKKKN